MGKMKQLVALMLTAAMSFSACGEGMSALAATITLPKSLKKIEDYAFNGCQSISDVEIPEGTVSIGNAAFANSSINSVIIPDTVTSIGNAAFADSTLSFVNIPDSVTSIGTGAFACTSLASVTLSKSITEIKPQTFFYTPNLHSVEIPYGVVSIDEAAFGCSGIQSITIPASVTYIASDAFDDTDVLIYATASSYAASWAEKNGYNWEEIQPTGVQEDLQEILNGDEDIENIGFESDDLTYIDTSDVTDAEDLQEIEEFNQNYLSKYIEAAQDCNDSAEELGSALGESASIFAETSFEESGDTMVIDYGDGSLFIDENIVNLPSNISIVDVKASDDGNSVELELSNGSYAVMTENGISLSYVSKGYSNALTSNNVEGLVSNGSATIETFKKWLNKIKDGFSLAKVKIDDYVEKTVKAKQEAELEKQYAMEQQWYQSYPTKQKRLINNYTKAVEECQKAMNIAKWWSGLGILVDLADAEETLNKWEQMQDLKTHGHPTVFDLTRYNGSEVEVNALNRSITVAKTGLVFSGLLTLADIVGNACGIFAKLSAVIPATWQIALTMQGASLGLKFIYAITNWGISKEVESAVNEAISCDKKLHEFVVFGCVYDWATKARLSGVTVSTGYGKATSDSKGYYSVNASYSIEEGLSGKAGVTITFTKKEYAVEEQTITVTPENMDDDTGYAINDDVYMKKMVTIQGTITDADTNQKISSAYVSCENGVTYDLKGDYSFQYPEGDYVFTFGSSGYEEKEVEIAARRNKNNVYNVELEQGGGDYITFGHYPQTAEGTDNTPIEWLVLARSGSNALVISRYELDTQPYNTEYTDVTWSSCTLRAWLNSTFLNKAFTSTEQAAILTTTVDNSQSQHFDWYGYFGWYRDEDDAYKSYANTSDKIFLLSYAEANKYFGVTYENTSNMASRAEPTAYAVAQGAYQDDENLTSDGKGACWWWLRSPGSVSRDAADVDIVGSLRDLSVNITCFAVRPALWVKLDTIQ